MRYRTEIDGLRAIAVMAVVLFHAGVGRVGQGYLGVDVFYVISGFLITSIIVREIEGERFSFTGFYARRVVRILPALLVLLAAVLVYACLVLMPPDIRAVGRSSAAAAGFIANIHFWNSFGYFDTSSETAPLLHTWSLGVEEQFYIFYPFILLVFARSRARLAAALLVLTIGSYAFAAYARTWGNDAQFYLLPARAWQLGLGAFVALGLVPRLRGAPLNNLVAGLGLAILVLSFFVRPPAWLNEGLAPAIGSTLIIAYADATLVQRALSLPPMRWIGWISYSVYLWHWPLITFYRMQYGLDLSMPQKAGLIIASLVLGALSFALVERPMLKRFRHASPRPVVSVGLAAILATIGASLLIARNSEHVRALPPEAVTIADYVEYRFRPDFPKQNQRGTCFTMGPQTSYHPEICARLAPDRPNIALIGDSHASQYYLALKRRYPQANVMQATAAGCAVLPGPRLGGNCRKVRDFVYGPLLERGGIDAVVLVERWTPRHLRFLDEGIARFREAGVPVVIVGSTLEYDARFPIALARAIVEGDPDGVARYRRRDVLAADRRVREWAEQAGVPYYSAIDAECPGGKCLYTVPGTQAPLHFDYGHLTEEGAEFILRDLRLPRAERPAINGDGSGGTG